MIKDIAEKLDHLFNGGKLSLNEDVFELQHLTIDNEDETVHIADLDDLIDYEIYLSPEEERIKALEEIIKLQQEKN